MAMGPSWISLTLAYIKFTFLLQISLEEILPDSFLIAFVSVCNFETLRLPSLHKGGSWVICLGEISFHGQ